MQQTKSFKHHRYEFTAENSTRDERTRLVALGASALFLLLRLGGAAFLIAMIIGFVLDAPR